MKDKVLWLAVRRALLLIVDAIEQQFDMPRTSELRKEANKT